MGKGCWWGKRRVSKGHAMRTGGLALALILLGCANSGNTAEVKALPSSRVATLPAVHPEVAPQARPVGAHEGQQMVSMVPLNGAESPWSLAELRKSASPDDGPEVWLEGYVNLADCSYGRADKPKPCLFASFADHPFAGGEERILIGGVPDSWEKLPPRARVRLLASYDRTLVGPLEFSRGKEALNYIDQADPRPTTHVAKSPTFADGSWSVGDLISRDDLVLDTEIEITAYVTSEYKCPPCPPTVTCSPCAMPSLTLGDTPDADSGPRLLVAGFAELPDKFNHKQRYKFSGTLRDSVGARSSDRGVMLAYRNHKPVR
jgi:hypothetical protein